MPSDSKPLPDTMLAHLSDSIWHDQAKVNCLILLLKSQDFSQWDFVIQYHSFGHLLLFNIYWPFSAVVQKMVGDMPKLYIYMKVLQTPNGACFIFV